MHLGQALQGWRVQTGRHIPASHSGLLVDWAPAGDPHGCSTEVRIVLSRRPRSTRQKSAEGEVIGLSEGHRAEIQKGTELASLMCLEHGAQELF